MSSGYQIHNFLTELGLNDKEATTYVSLLEMGPQPASQIARKMGIPRSSALFCLNTLENKGFAKKELVKNMQRFTPISPSEIERLICRKQDALNKSLEELDELLPSMNNMIQNFVPTSKIQLFEGVEGICKMIDFELEKDRPIYFISGHKLDKKIRDYILAKWIPARKKFKSKCQMIVAENDLSKDYIKQAGGIYEWIGMAKQREGSAPFQLTIAIYEDYVQLLSCKERITGVLIENTYLAATMKSIFEMLKNTEKIESI